MIRGIIASNRTDLMKIQFLLASNKLKLNLIKKYKRVLIKK